MNRKKIDLLWLYVSIIAFLFVSAMFLLMPLDNNDPSLKVKNATKLIGAGFWGFLIVGIVSQVILSKRRKLWYRIQHINERRGSVRKIGLITFGSNGPALIADIILVVSLIGLIVAVITTKAIGYSCYVFLAIFFFAFCMHCILNGKVYYHITHHYDSNNKYERSSLSENNTEGEK